MGPKIQLLLSFQALHHIANGIIFQIPRSQLFLNLLLQAISTSLIVWGYTQLIPSKENDKCQSPEIHLQWIKRWSNDPSSSIHIVHLQAKLKLLILSISFVGTFPLVASQAKKRALAGALDLLVSPGKSRLLDPSQASLQKLLTKTFPFETWGQTIF